LRNQLFLEFEDSEDWKLSELTINPFIYNKNNFSTRYSCDMWIELCLTPTNELSSLPKSLIFMDWKDKRIQPFAEIGLGHDKQKFGINQIMYAEIWFAFIRTYSQRGDFMRTGYKQASRLATPRLEINETLKFLDIQTFSKKPSDLQREIYSIYDRYQLLNRFFHAKDTTKYYSLLKNQLYGKTAITIDENLLSHIAFRRKPWDDQQADETVLYPASPHIKYDGYENYSRINFDYCFPTHIERPIKTSESIGCWLVFGDLSVELSPAGIGRSFEIEFDLETNVEVENSNMFFRTPPYYKVLDRGYTPLCSYNTPPRLFSLWDGYLNSTFYASKNNRLKAGSRHMISSTFEDSRYEFDKLVALFLLGIMIGPLLSVFIRSMDIENSYKLPSLLLAAMVAVIGVLLYRNKTRYPLLLAASIIPIACFLYLFIGI
jgi:hypothetical protein